MQMFTKLRFQTGFKFSFSVLHQSVAKMLYLFYVFSILNFCSGLNILCVFPFNARGHNILFESLTTGLAKLGHKVDVITHYPVEDPPKNYQLLVNLSGKIENLMNNYTIDVVKQNDGRETEHIAKRYGNKICQLLGLKEMQDVLKNTSKNPPYDLLMTEVSCLLKYIDKNNYSYFILYLSFK